MNKIRTVLYALMLAGGTGFSGTFTADFKTQDTSTFAYNGAGTLSDSTSWLPFIDTNRLILTLNQNDLSGSFSPYDFDSGMPVESFKASFQLQFGPGTTTPADGAAFSFGPEINQYSTSYNEVGAGGNAFAVSFHTYTSNGGPAVDVYLYGQRIGHVPVAVGDMVNSQLQDVTIELKANSTLSVTYRGQVLYTNLYLAGWGPCVGYYIISARTGGANEQTHLANVRIDSTVYTSPVAPTITAAPQNASVAEGDSASFSVAFDGTGPFSIQWLKNGTEIQDATNQTLTLSPALYGDNTANIAARITNDGGSITSAAATLTVAQDTIKPTVVKTAGDMTFTSVTVTYSEPVTDTAINLSNYSFDQGVSVSSVDRLTPTSVRLITSQMAQSGVYTLTINGVQDIATIPNTIAANTKLTVRTFVFMNGTVLRKKYDGFSNDAGNSDNSLYNDPRYSSLPDHVDLLPAWEFPKDGSGRDPVDHVAWNYFDTIEGYFMPPSNGDYVFWVCGADHIWLYLSTDDDPANKVQVAHIGGWTQPRGWNVGQPDNTTTPMGDARTDTSTLAQMNWPSGNTITLTANKRYYMMLVHHDPSWAGGDQMGVTFTKAGEPVPAAGDPSKLTGNVIGYFIDPDGASITFAQQPQSKAVQEGASVTFSVTATGVSAYGTNIAFQWQAAPKNSTTFTNIPGATKASYSTPPLTPRSLYDGMQFRVVGTMPPITQNSDVATLTVNPNTSLPIPTVGAMLDSVAGTVDIGVGFDKPMDEASASNLANYSISTGTIVSLSWNSNRFTANSQNPAVMVRKQTALLKVTGMTGTSGSLTIKNVSDAYGNQLTSTTIPFTVDTKMKWGVVGANESGGWNAVVPVGPNAFDIYSDGTTEWTTYDEATFVYEQITGDFDKKVRVEYQDGSSQWARAGLIARDVLNFGVTSAAQRGSAAAGNNTPTFPYDGQAGRYQKCHVNPVGATLGGPGNAGNAAWEGNRRLDTGGGCTSAITGQNSTPLYPNAWCRIKRVGQTFTVYRSDDGVNWVTLGSTTWGLDDQSKKPMPDTVYVGPEFSPETGNITNPSDRGTFLAQFREYGDYVAVFNPQLKIGTDTSGKTTITWTSGTLMASPTLDGTYSTVNGAASPFVVTPGSNKTMFYRVKP